MAGTQDRSKLRLLVPTVGNFFTPLQLHDAFISQDSRRFISWRRFVPPSFNDIRLVLNTAQVMSLVRSGPLELVTFDGDVTLYNDGESLNPDSPIIPRIMQLLRRGTKVGIVTAAGYTEARRYYERLHGLLDGMQVSDLTLAQRQGLMVLGGESNYLYKYSESAPFHLERVPRENWLLDDMRLWQEEDIMKLLDVAELALKDCVANLRLDAQIIRKDRY
jgi:IMP and pyridine-specific 5'-nucleotidase